MCAAWMILTVMFVSIPVLAQSGAGAIQGTVTDSTGAVIPKVSVVVVNQASAQSYRTATNGAGFYSVPGLFAGNYGVTFSAPGMKQYETSIALQVAQTAVIGPVLSPGAVTEKVVVNAEAVQLATYDSGTVSAELDNARIDQLPMNGRDITLLATATTPGLVNGSKGQRSNGMMSSGMEYVQDGAPITDRDIGGPANQVDPDSIQEMKVETSGSNAKYATPATAVITTKSGTNQFHGSFFETAKNNAVGVARQRQNPTNFVAPRYIRNEFGASVGGPIRIPGLYNGKDKSFFFFAYERMSLRSGGYVLGTTPTAAIRQGDFSLAATSGNQAETIYDPNTTNPVTYQRTPFSGNQIPVGRISPLAKVMYAIAPLPTNSQNPFTGTNLAYAAPNNQTAPTITFRLDHRFNDNNSAYLRYTSYNSNQFGSVSGGTASTAPTLAGAGLPAQVSNVNGNTVGQYSGALGFTHIFSPTLVSQTVIGNTWRSTWGNVNPGGSLAPFEQQLGLPNNFGEGGMPNIPWQGDTNNLLYSLTGTQSLWGGPMIISNIDEDLTKTIGKHQFYFGGRYRHETMGALPDRTPDGVSFNGMGTGVYDPTSTTSYKPLPGTGDQNADLFLGNAFKYVVKLNAPREHWVDQEFDAYVQDDWHVNERLTLNLGMRWEAHPVAVEENNSINGFDYVNDATVLGEPIPKLIQKGFTTQTIITNLQNIGVKFETATQAGLPPHLVYGYNAIFDPRLGFAYSLFGSGRGTVVRAGFGRYSYPIPLRNFYASAKGNLPVAASYAQDYTQGAQSPDGANNYILRSKQSVTAGQNSANVVNSSTINAILPGVGELVNDPHFPPQINWEFNATVEQPLKPDSVLRVSYVWNRSENLDQQDKFNATLSDYVWEVKTGTTPPTGTYSAVAKNAYDQKTYGDMTNNNRIGWSQYNGLQANYQRQFKHGYAYQVSYAYQKVMRVGGNTFRDSSLQPLAAYAPGTAPSIVSLNRFQNYKVDSEFPRQQLGFNGIVDLPLGRGKKFLGHVNRFEDELIGGYQIAFDGSGVTQYFSPNAGNWGGDNPAGTGTVAPIQVYKKGHKIVDCNSGTCLNGYLWFNGYFTAKQLSKVSGLPSGYQPYQTPINVGTINGTDNNKVNVTMNAGPPSSVTFSPGPSLNRFSKTVLLGPVVWSSDVSIFKVFPITERVNFRVNFDAFNAFNIQGLKTPNTTTGETFYTPGGVGASSYNQARQMQLSARLTF
ncbi:MAG TPA: carboxypeptidase-like regulatory domain-containing protein [Terracidiphilus sp.]|nr:carboxypeptidase-like regulatory domain-containing protein [Terracidiphilus sp.]